MFPSRTSTAPSRSTFSGAVPMIVINCAIAVDASSADRFVDSPSMIIVRVNFAMSCVATPS